MPRYLTTAMPVNLTPYYVPPSFEKTVIDQIAFLKGNNI